MRIIIIILIGAFTSLTAASSAFSAPGGSPLAGILCGQDWGWEEDDSVKKPGPPPSEPQKPEKKPEGGGSGWGESESGSSGSGRSGSGGGWGSGSGKAGGDEWSGGEWGGSSADSRGSAGEEAPPPEMRGKGAMISIAVWFSSSMPVGGQAGSGIDAPSWSQAFGLGSGIGVSAELRLLPCLCARFGFDWVSHQGNEFVSMGTRNRFSNLSIVGLAVGPRFYILTDRPVDKWFGASDRPFTGFAPFIGFDFGLGFSSAVSWVEPPPEWPYWSGSVLLSDNFAFGAEYRFSSSFGAYLEFGVGTMSAPAAAQGQASALKLNDAGSLLAFKIRAGLLLAF